MDTIRIIDGLDISRVSLGAGGRGDPLRDPEQFRIMDAYLDLGGNCFDTARMYAAGACDQSLGQYLRERKNRARVILCTKGSHPADASAMHISRLSPEQIRADLEQSLGAIGTDYTDMHLLHRDDPKIPVERIVPALDALVRDGLARAVGVSNWTVGRIVEANQFAKANALAPISVCQLHFSLLLTTAHRTGDVTHVPMDRTEELWYRESGFPIMGFGNQGRGYIARHIAGQPQKEGSQRYYGYIPENARRCDRLKALSDQLGHSPASVALAYVRDSGLCASALSGFSSLAQLHDAMEALRFNLTPEQIRFLECGQ